MMHLGQYNKLTILRFTNPGAYLGDDEDNDVLLPTKYLTPDLTIGDEIEVFLYLDSEDRLVATTEKPLIELNSFEFLKVKEVTHFGAFLDWGLEKDLLEVRAHRDTQRQARLKSKIPTFAIVGYTNAGKSTLLNALTDAGVMMEDKLFCTLDTTTRKFMLPNHQNILLVDTVGFIRKLPHTLIEAFKSTLEEVCYTDILLHIIDISHPLAKEHAKATLEVLKELKADKKPIITVLNKMDKASNPIIAAKYRLEFPKTVAISATEKTGFDDLMQIMMREIKALRKTFNLRIPQKEYALIAELMQLGQVIHSDYEENDVLLTVELPREFEHKITAFKVEEQETF
jgi:GTP-binding protein HflX